MRLTALVALFVFALPLFAQDKEPLFTSELNVTPPPIKTDKDVNYNYDIVYVRALRAGDDKHKRFYTDFSQPVTMEPGADLMLLHPDGSEELLVAGGQGVDHRPGDFVRRPVVLLCPSLQPRLAQPVVAA